MPVPVHVAVQVKVHVADHDYVNVGFDEVVDFDVYLNGEQDRLVEVRLPSPSGGAGGEGNREAIGLGRGKGEGEG